MRAGFAPATSNSCDMPDTVPSRRTPRLRAHLVVVALLLGLLPLSAGADVVHGADCLRANGLPTAEGLAFDEPVYVDPDRAGGEPVIIAAEDGSLLLSSHAGTTHAYKNPAALAGVDDFAVGYANQTLNWRSADGGRTWDYVGLAGLNAGPHSATSTGFSDPGFAIDDGGRVYNVEIDLANVAVFSSSDDGQSWAMANPNVAPGDRPWMTGGSAEEAFLFIRTGPQLWRSTDGGITFTPQAIAGGFDIYSQIYRDPLDMEAGLVGVTADGGPETRIGFSDDEGVTWSYTEPMGFFEGNGDQIFAPFDLDKGSDPAHRGTVYVANGRGYTGAGDTTADGLIQYNAYDRATESFLWEEAQVIPIPEGDVLWTWLVAGEDGRVALAWYQTLVDPATGEVDNTRFHLYVAQTLNGRGTEVDCDGDGDLDLVPPQWTVVDASGRPIAEGAVCLSGTTCNANPDFESGDRRLGDFFQINYDRDGRLVIASGDTMLTSATGGPKPVSNPIFIGQSAGEPLLTTPLPVRPTRCLMDLEALCGG
jgi:hypothetical protein